MQVNPNFYKQNMEAGGEELTVASSAFDEGRGSQLYKNKCDDIKSQLS